MNSGREFKWASLVVDCIKRLRGEGFNFVDQEVIPNLNGTPNDIFVWFICEHYHAKEKFNLQAATAALKNKLQETDFPKDAIKALRTGATSQTEIEAGGGRFYFFR